MTHASFFIFARVGRFHLRLDRGRSALRRRWPYWVRLHIAGMGLSFIVMLIAFYVDKGKQLPLWKDLPHFMADTLAIGMPLILRAVAAVGTRAHFPLDATPATQEIP